MIYIYIQNNYLVFLIKFRMLCPPTQESAGILNDRVVVITAKIRHFISFILLDYDIPLRVDFYF